MNNLVTDSVTINSQVTQTVNIWIWIAIIELFVILYLASRFATKSKKESRKIKDKLKSDPVDLENTINSAFNAKPLYDKLKVRCHPDRFVNTPFEDEANAIFQEIQANRHSYNKLKELERKSERDLHINFEKHI